MTLQEYRCFFSKESGAKRVKSICRIAAPLEAGRHRAVIRSALIRGCGVGVGGLGGGLLLALVASSESSGKAPHRGAGGRAFARVTGDRAADCAHCRAPSGAFGDVPLRGLVWLR